MSSGRLEAFSDGVFAIAATLLVLELRVPPPGGEPLVAGLLAQWPSYAGYFVSFLTIGIIWVNHHSLFSLVHHVDRMLLFLNLVLLLIVSLIAFPTAVVGQWITSPGQASVAAALLGSMYLLMGLSFGAIWMYAVWRHDVTLIGIDRASARSAVPRFTVGNVVYLLGIVVAFFNPLVSLFLYAVVAIYYVFPTLPEPRPDARPEADSER